MFSAVLQWQQPSSWSPPVLLVYLLRPGPPVSGWLPKFFVFRLSHNYGFSFFIDLFVRLLP